MSIDLDLVTPTTEPPRRQGWVGVMATVLAVSAAVAALAVGTTPLPIGVRAESSLLYWIATLVDAQPRGTVARDPSFATGLARLVREAATTSESPAFLGADRRPVRDALVRVLFAEDVDDRRVALVAFRAAGASDASRYAVTRLLWLAGPRGATPQTLAGAVTGVQPADGTAYETTSATPLTWADLGRAERPVRVALAPPACELATAPSADLTQWRPEPTGSYLVRSGRDEEAEYWQVTCGGVVRESRPAPRGAASDDSVDQILAAAVGTPARSTVQTELDLLFQTFGFELLELPQVFWAGPADQTVQGTVTLLAAPAARGGWLGAAWIFVELQPGVTWGQMPYFSTVADLADPSAVLGIPLGRDGAVLVLAPASAATARLVDRAGTVLDEAAVADRMLLLNLPTDGPPAAAVLVEALDASGEPLSTSPLADTFVVPDRQTNWN